jgi:hypothetical protein
MPDRPSPSPLAVAMQWVGRIFGVVGAMVLPAWGGSWLDQRWGTAWLAPAGMAAGLVLGIAYLLAITRLPSP